MIAPPVERCQASMRRDERLVCVDGGMAAGTLAWLACAADREMEGAVPIKSDEQIRGYLEGGDWESLFLDGMGWDYAGNRRPVEVDDSDLRAVCVADKKGVGAWRVDSPGGLPGASEQQRVVRALKRASRDSLIVFTAPDLHMWLWPEQRPGGAYRLVRHDYPAGSPPEQIVQRLGKASFTVDEETGLTAGGVRDRVRFSFNSDEVTNEFYSLFKKQHQLFLGYIEGITGADGGRDEAAARWYASVLLNRLMFIYFIQSKGFLDGDKSYLRTKLGEVRDHFGEDQFYAFFSEFLLPLFHEGLGSDHPEYADPAVKRIIGNVPYVNGGIFDRHPIELEHDGIRIKDEAFEQLFDFFDGWRWHLDERPTGDDKEINPDVLGFIFEQYINYTEAGQKDKGAYYTKPDVTGYMSVSAIIPAIADRLIQAGLPDPCLLLPDSGDDYLHDAMGYGCDKDLPGPESELPPSEFPDAASGVALPGERWCDVTHRRKRHAEQKHLVNTGGLADINDAVTQNLDLAVLMSDYLHTLNTASECQTAFDVLRSLTVCDPTCGSGAFLFAALEVLDPLYESVLDRAAELRDRSGGAETAECLAEMEQHPSRRYATLKTLCLNNLYGVDLMDEAPEIARLRLFLKLAAQIDDPDHIEPLPDLDFNIKTGNLLVGIADPDDARNRLGYNPSGQGTLDYDNRLTEIEGLAEQVAGAYDSFVEQQASQGEGPALSEAKTALAAALHRAREQADDLCYDLRREQQERKEWQATHRPFHWFVEFPSVWQHGGFDIILGNPPYIRVEGKKRDHLSYKWVGYQAENCPDLYAICTERSSSLLNKQGRFAMIVMLSLCFDKDYEPLREFLQTQASALWISAFSRIPDGLFSGSARVRNTIVVASRQSGLGMFTSRCRRWLTSSRSDMFATQRYIQPVNSLLKCGGTPQWPLADDPLTAEAFARLIETQKPLGTVVERHGQFKLGYKTTAQYMLGIYEQEPPIVDPTSGLPVTTNSSRSGWIKFSSSRHRDMALLCLTGRWGYLWWLMFGDEFHVTRGVLIALPCDIERLASAAASGGLPSDTPCDMELVSLVERLLSLSNQMKEEMPKHLAWKVNSGFKVGRYNMLKCRHITDEADWLLAQAWGLTREQFEAAGNLRDRMTFGNKD